MFYSNTQYLYIPIHSFNSPNRLIVICIIPLTLTLTVLLSALTGGMSESMRDEAINRFADVACDRIEEHISQV